MENVEKTVKVWDPIVRIGHWALVLGFFIAYLTEDDFLTQHIWAGYVVGSVVIVRLVWGVVGSRNARFVNFVRSPAATLRYLRLFLKRRPPRYVGHNPAGAAMIVALILSLSGTVTTGLVLYAIEEGSGPLAGLVSSGASHWPPGSGAESEYDETGEKKEAFDNHEDEEVWEEAHEILANLTLLLVMIHVLGVVASSSLHEENLVKSMIHGRKRTAIDD